MINKICTNSHSELKDAAFDIQTRGQIEVKGKGLMTTYFLLGNPSMSEDGIMGRDGRTSRLYKDNLEEQKGEGKIMQCV